MRVRPSATVVSVILAGYLAFLVLASWLGGIRYDAAADSAGNFLVAVALPMVVLAVLLAALTTWLGW